MVLKGMLALSCCDPKPEQVDNFAGVVPGSIEEVLSKVFDLRRWHNVVLNVIDHGFFCVTLSGVRVVAYGRADGVAFFVDEPSDEFALMVIRHRVAVLNGAKHDDAGNVVMK